MIIKEISKLLGKANSVVVIDTNTQWVGEGGALYALHKFPRLSETTAAAAFDLDENKNPNITIHETAPFGVDLLDACDSEIHIEKYTETLVRGSAPGERFFTGEKLIFISEKYLRPLADLDDGELRYYLRWSGKGEYVVVKYGMLAMAAIFPIRVDFNHLISEAEIYLKTLRLSKSNTDEAEEGE